MVIRATLVVKNAEKFELKRKSSPKKNQFELLQLYLGKNIGNSKIN